ncbi:MAG: asparaginase [Gemmatimonadetes bacterium]|nr:asparaginase [Gemmatimonadota bacterium]
MAHQRRGKLYLPEPPHRRPDGQEAFDDMHQTMSYGVFVIVASMAMRTLAAAPALLAQGGALPKVVIVTTGGTIAGGPAGARYTGEDFLRAVPQIGKIAQVSVEEFTRVGSSKITPTHWLGLAKRINQIFRERPDVTGVLVTHGTDSLEETAYFLNLTVRDRRPVVVVGAMRDWSKIAPDGPVNLYNGVRVAISPDAVGKGALVVLNDEINSARDVRKTDALRLHTFRALNQGMLGVADEDRVIFYRQSLNRHTADSEFDVSRIDSLPHVPMVADYTGSDGQVLLNEAARGAQGIVVMGFPSGLLSDGSSGTAVELASRGVPVVITSRAPLGRVSDSYRVGQPGAPRPIAGRDLSLQKARILLMLALTRTRDFQEIQRIFDTY